MPYHKAWAKYTYAPKDNKIIVFKDEGAKAKYIVSNPKQLPLFSYIIDGGVIAKDIPISRCDYLFVDDTNRRVYFIELKGSRIAHAINQILDTIKNPMIYSNILNLEIHARVSISNYPKCTSAQKDILEGCRNLKKLKCTTNAKDLVKKEEVIQ